MPVLEPVGRPYSDVSHVGVTIRRTPDGLHSGLLYQLPGEEPRVLHLAFHYLLLDEVAAEPFRWTQMGLDEDNRLVLATLLSRIAGIRPLISYGFDSEGVCFAPGTGELLSRLSIGKGLTCATFIVAALRTYGHVLLDPATWPDRAEDREWQEKILELLERRASAEHVDALRNDIGAKRLRPDEVVGSATSDHDLWPLAFPDARALADQVLADLA